jgi:pyruvate dehydrogenase E1 component beta subunit
MNQLINIAAKTRYMFGSDYSVPMVVRAIIGRSWGQGAQHSQSFHSYFTHIPGLQVVAPTTPYDAKGCMVAAIRNNNPVIFVEHRMLYKNKGYVPKDLYEIKPEKSRVLVEGDAITIVAISHMVVEALRAANILREMGINAEVIDPVYLAPMDIRTIVNSVLKTKKLLVVDHSWTSSGLSSEIVARVMEDISDSAAIKAARMGYAESPCPTTRSLEDFFYPTPNSIAKKAYGLISGKKDWIDKNVASVEINEFKGPF